MAQRQSGSANVRYSLVNINFNERERAEYAKWSDGRGSAGVDDLLSILEGGFKVSISYDKASLGFLCSLTAKDTPNKKLLKKVFLIRHRDVIKLLGLALYFYSVITNSGEQFPKDMDDDLDW